MFVLIFLVLIVLLWLWALYVDYRKYPHTPGDFVDKDFHVRVQHWL